MIRSLWTASTGMKAQMTNLDVIANNMANVNTVGFKKSRADFQDLLYQTMKSPGEATGPESIHPVGQQVGVGTKLSGITKQFTIGSLTQTERDLDVAIAGQGFFQVQGPGGNVLYSRDGALKVSNQGTIVNSDGLAMVDLGTVPSNARAVNFSPTGEVSYVDDTGAATTIGTLQLAMFLNPSGLSAQGSNLYTESPASGTATLSTPGSDASGTIQQHFLELSNVSVVEEMVNMISAQRAYEINSKVIKATDEMLSAATQLAR
ncbi:MAG: flagellar basal-body rod protein FlgG [Chlamydiales bacterium]|jgi:flagellar basal-body rod protein FlgG